MLGSLTTFRKILICKSLSLIALLLSILSGFSGSYRPSGEPLGDLVGLQTYNHFQFKIAMDY